MKKIFFLLLALIGFYNVAVAQPDLPNMAALSQGGINVLSWNNPYTTGVKSVTIERSSEPGLNFVQIGAIKDLKKPSQFFTDAAPLPGDNYYRVKIIFSSDLEWLGNETMIHVDSAMLAKRKAAPSQDSINALVTQLGVNTPPEAVKTPYKISQYVYTNPYNGNVIIELQNPYEISYRLEFFDEDGKKVLEIPRINDEMVVLDKRNFQKNGQYKFVVYKGAETFTDGFVAIY